MTDFSDRDGVIWFDGELINWRDANIHFLTHSLHYGGGVFEGVRAYNGNIFKLQEHSERLLEGGRIVGLEIPYTVEEINAACVTVLEANNLKDGYLRPAAWRGSQVMGLSQRGTKTHVAIAAWAWPSYFSPAQRMQGVRLIMAPWRRPAPDTALTNAKTAGLYQICTSSKEHAEAKGFDDALMLDYRGYVAEATGANIFFYKDGVLHTPIPDCFLNGITRKTVMEIAAREGIKVLERHILPEEMGCFDEAFLTGTAAEITPISEAIGYRYTPGKICELMIHEYKKLTR